MYFKLNFTLKNILSCCFSQNGQYLGCSDDSGIISLWQSNSIHKNYDFIKLHHSKINKILFYSNFLYSASSDGNCKVVDYKTCKEIRTLRNSRYIGVDDIDCFKETILTTNNDGTLKLWDIRIKIPIESISHGFHLKISRFIYNPYMFITIGILSEMLLWDIRKIEKRKLQIYQINRKCSHITSVTISKNGKSFLISDLTGNFSQFFISKLNKSLKYYNMESIAFLKGRILKNFSKITSDINGEFLAHGYENGFVSIWSIQNGKIIHNIKEHTGIVNDITFHPNSKMFCSCGSDNSLVFRTI